MTAETKTAIAWIVFGTFAIAFSPIFVRESELGPIATAAYRVFLALPVLALWIKIEPSSDRPLTRKDWRNLILAGLFFAGDLTFWHASILNTTIANASLFATSTPVFVALGAWLLFKERIQKNFIFGLIAGLVGAAMLVGASAQMNQSNLVGDAYGIITAMFFSAYLLTVKHLRIGVSAAKIMFWSSFVTAPVLFLMAALYGETLWPQTSYGWLILFGLAWISHAAGQGMVAHAVARLPASFSALGMLTEPVFAAIFAWWLLSEAVTLLQLGGGVAILIGIHMARPKADSSFQL